MQTLSARARLAVSAILYFSGTATAAPITVDQVLQRATQRPLVAMAAASSEAARHQADQAGRSPYHPELSAGVGPRLAGASRTLAVQLGLSHTFELGGKRAARRAVAEATLATAEAEQLAAGALARIEAWRTFQLALIARERVAMAVEGEQLAIQIETATRERQLVGFGTQLELNLTNAEVGRARHERLDAERQHEQALAQLASAIGAAGSERLEPAGELVPPPPLPAGSDSAERLLAQALRQRPEASLARAASRVAVAEVRAADAEATPDVSLGVTYAHERDPELSAQTVLATASIGLPLFNRNQGARRAARALARRAELEVSWTTTEIERGVRLTIAGYQRALEAVRGFDREVNERLHENLELARESYTSGKIDYFQFNVVRRELLASRNAYLDAFEETVEAWSAVQQATGGEVMP
jgi:outer membrane protein, heavy metal efflux system